MRILVVLLFFSCSVNGQNHGYPPFGGSCDTVQGLKMMGQSYNEGADYSMVPNDYSGNVVFCERGRIIEFCNIKNGKPDGESKRWYMDGSLKKTCRYKNGNKNGLCSRYDRNGIVSRKQNYMDGMLITDTSWWGEELEFIHNFRDGKKDGLCSEYHFNGQLKSESNYKKGMIVDDSVVYFDENGNIDIIKYTETIIYGGRCDTIDGIELSQSFGVMDGPPRGEIPSDYNGNAFYCNEFGRILNILQIKDGVYDGLNREWHENGQLEEEVRFKNGEWTSHRTWYKNGQIESEGNYKNGQIDGLWRQWGENGQLRSEKNYKDGNKAGSHKVYYKNGQIESEENYKNDQLDGILKWWFENGQLKMEENYRGGKILSDKVIRYSKHGGVECTYYYKNGELIDQEGQGCW